MYMSGNGTCICSNGRFAVEMCAEKEKIATTLMVKGKKYNLHQVILFYIVFYIVIQVKDSL